MLGHKVKLGEDELAAISQHYDVPHSKRRWSGCGHWVHNEPPNDGCIPTFHLAAMY